MPRRRGRGSRAEARVARLYEMAGYRVRRNMRSRAGEIDILATRGGERLLVEVKSGRSPITSTDILKVARKARHHRAKPVIRKSPRRPLTGPAARLARRLGVRIRNY